MNKNQTLVMPIVISVFSLFTLYNTVFNAFNLFGIASCIVAVVGIWYYIINNSQYDKYFLIWIYMQLPSIYFENVDSSITNFLNAFPGLFNVLHLQYYITLNLRLGGALNIGGNFIPIGFYFMLKYFNVYKPIGARLKFSPLKHAAFPDLAFPIHGTIISLVGRETLKGIYEIRLDHPTLFTDSPITQIQIKPKDNYLIDIREKAQVCGLLINSSTNAMPSFKFSEWIVVQTTTE